MPKEVPATQEPNPATSRDPSRNGQGGREGNRQLFFVLCEALSSLREALSRKLNPAIFSPPTLPVSGRVATCRGVRFLFLLLLALPLHAQSVPHFPTAAAARAWGEARERAGQYEAAASAYEQEAVIRRRVGDPQGGEFEHRRALRLKTDVALAVTMPVPETGQHLAKLEPKAGCYFGALDDYAGRNDADRFAKRIGRPLALCYDYSSYGDPFPMAWARRQAEAGRAIQIAWEPNRISEVQDDEYLNRWAKDAAQCGTPVFLRFGGEMNGNWTPWGHDPAAYRRAFRLVHAVVNRWASNVALVWAPGAVPTYNLDLYYPGDDVVDWVGISLYLVRYNDDNLSRPAWRDNPASFIAPFYTKYAARKPLCLAECGVSRRSKVEGSNADQFAAARISDLLEAIKIRYPRLKMFCWFTRNNLELAQAGRRLNDYSLPEGSGALAGFKAAISDPYFLSSMDDVPPYQYQVIGTHLPSGYTGSLSAAISTYSLHPTLEITRGSATRATHHPFSVFVPPGNGPLTVTVRDEGGRTVKTVRFLP